MNFRRFNLSLLAISFLLSCNKETTTTALLVSAGNNQTIPSRSGSATLTGSITGGITPNMHYYWTLVSGPNVPVYENQDSVITTVKNLITGTYIFQFEATNNKGISNISTVTVIVSAPSTYTVTIQPGKYTGQDAEVCYVPNLYSGDALYGHDSLLRIQFWTYAAQGGTQGATRSFIKFTSLDTIPANANIISAKLSLTALSYTPYAGWVGDSYYPGSPYNVYGDNRLWIQRVISNWDQSTITFNNQPPTTAVNEVEIPASTSQFNYSVTNLDITQLVKDMRAASKNNYGLCLKLQSESIYKSMAFDASETKADSSTAPKLVVTYQY